MLVLVVAEGRGSNAILPARIPSLRSFLWDFFYTRETPQRFGSSGFKVREEKKEKMYEKEKERHETPTFQLNG